MDRADWEIGAPATGLQNSALAWSAGFQTGVLGRFKFLPFL